MDEWSLENRENLAQEAKAKENENKPSYGVGALMAVGVQGLPGYYFYQRGSPGDNNAAKVTLIRSVEVHTQMNKFEME